MYVRFSLSGSFLLRMMVVSWGSSAARGLQHLSHTVSLPLKNPIQTSGGAKSKVVSALKDIAQKEAYWELGTCEAGEKLENEVVLRVPQFGWTIGVRSSCEGGESTAVESKLKALELTFDNLSFDECGWLCVRLLRADALGSPSVRSCVDLQPLAKRVVDHYASLGPSVGEDAQLWAQPAAMSRVLPAQCLDALERDGVVVVENALDLFAGDDDSALHRSPARSLVRGFKSLDGAGLLARTGQGPEVRTDAVGWFDDFAALFPPFSAEDKSSGGDHATEGPSPDEIAALELALGLLRGVAAHLNGNGVHGEQFVDILDKEEGPSKVPGSHFPGPAPPLPPATSSAPLTVPTHVMGAQYPADGKGGYVAHSDNGLEWVAPASVAPRRLARRRNHRQFTAIVYANSPDWRAEDGGCLRVYLGSGGGPGTPCGDALLRGGNRGLDEAVAAWPREKVVEVVPRGGTLLVFDSKLIHRVLPCSDRSAEPRRALTIWVGRPVGNQARGETWDVGDLLDEEGAGGGGDSSRSHETPKHNKRSPASQGTRSRRPNVNSYLQ